MPARGGAAHRERSALDEPWFGFLFLPPVLLDDEGCGLWIEEMDFDPRPVFAQVEVPTLLFYGEADSWSPVPVSVEAWRQARGDEVEIVVIPQAEHELTLPDGTLAPEYERTLVAWLCRRSRLCRSRYPEGKWPRSTPSRP